ncbi:hypothetical protein [Natronococcus jeotgali]|uniref:hypothetical protein n=1 Tax=Natronococcus jeotgali TaxID=413812 RepID=UPI00373AE603
MAARPDASRLDSTPADGALIGLESYPPNAVRFLTGRDPTVVDARTRSSGESVDRVDEHAAFRLEFPTRATARTGRANGRVPCPLDGPVEPAAASASSLRPEPRSAATTARATRSLARRSRRRRARGRRRSGSR